MKKLILFIHIIFIVNFAYADVKYHPIRFELNTEKESYYEGEKITFNITITNSDKQNTYPVLVPHTQNTGQKLFYLNVYDKANNTMLLRYTEDKKMNMMVHDTGTVQIRYLKPLEQIVIPIYLNDFENYFNYHTQNSSHHSLGVPLFAGVYKVNVTYNPKGIALGDSIYHYYNDIDVKEDVLNDNKLAMKEEGDVSNLIFLKIKRSADTVVSIEGKRYAIQTDGDRYKYFKEPKGETNSLIHITNLPPDSCSIVGEYFYNQFPDLYNEYIKRFDYGDIMEYRKFTNNCPDELYVEKFNELKQKTYFASQLQDKRFYNVSYFQPGDLIHQEKYCAPDGTLCTITTYTYNKKGELIKTQISEKKPCVIVQIDGESKSVHQIIKTE